MPLPVAYTTHRSAAPNTCELQKLSSSTAGCCRVAEVRAARPGADSSPTAWAKSPPTARNDAADAARRLEEVSAPRLRDPCAAASGAARVSALDKPASAVPNADCASACPAHAATSDADALSMDFSAVVRLYRGTKKAK